MANLVFARLVAAIGFTITGSKSFISDPRKKESNYE